MECAAYEASAWPARDGMSRCNPAELDALCYVPATWAAFNTSLFRRTASVSGSLWYPGFVDYVRDHELAPTVERMYFSVGNRERKVPNRTMRSVQDDTIRIRSLVEERGVRTTFDLNSGNHFTGFARRMRKALAWTLRQEDVPGPRGA